MLDVRAAAVLAGACHLGRLDAAGRLTVLGREDDRVVGGGENASFGQVEDVLLSAVAVVDAAVTGMPDPSHAARAAHVLLSRPVEARELQELASERPARTAVHVVPELPRGASGTVLPRELPAARPEQGA